MPLDEVQIRRECRLIKDKGIDDIAVVGVFSPLDTTGRHETHVRKIVQEEIPDADIVCSRDSKNTPLASEHMLTFGSRPTRIFGKRKRHNTEYINT